MRGKITKRQIDVMTAGTILADEEVRGFVARKLSTGAVTHGFRYRDKTTGKQRWIGLGLHGSITPDQARIQAKKRAGEVADGRDPAVGNPVDGNNRAPWRPSRIMCEGAIIMGSKPDRLPANGAGCGSVCRC
jgi:hypothetical protein